MIKKINEAYSKEEIGRLTELAKTFAFKDIDLDKMRKADLVVIIGDLIERVNNAMNVQVNSSDTVDQVEYDKVVSKLRKLENVKNNKGGMKSPNYNEVVNLMTGDGSSAWN